MQPALPIGSSKRKPLTGGDVTAVLAVLAALGLLALLAPGVGPAMEAAYLEVDPASPYLATSDPLLLYGTMPLSLLGSIALLLAPGLLAGLAFGVARNFHEWLLKGFAISLVLVSAAAAAAQAALGSPLTGVGFIATVAVLAAGCATVLWWRVARGLVPAERWPVIRRWYGAGFAVVGVVLVPLVFVTVLAPKFFLEAFNGDGAHAYEATRLLLYQAMPFWPPDSGEPAAFPGTKTFLFVYPVSWFLRLYGEHEAAIRLPLALFMLLLCAGIGALFARNGIRRLTHGGLAVVWMSIVSFALVMSFSATYDPYCADIGLPATQDTLLMVCFLGALLGFVQRQPVTLLVFTFCTMTCSPAGLMMIGAWLVAVPLVYRPRPWRLWGTAAGAVGITVAIAVAMPVLLYELGQPAPGSEHGLGGLLRKFRFVLPFDASRLVLLVLPAGIYPIWGLLRWRRADDETRALWVTALLVFAPYYGMAFVSLHYFVPAMVLPLVAFWMHPPWEPDRNGVEASGRIAARAALCPALALVAIGVALPTGLAVHTASRELGAQIEVRGLPSYQAHDPGCMAPVAMLDQLFPRDADPSVPERAYGGSPLAWNYYAQRAPSGGATNYLLVGATTPGPAGATPVARADGVRLYVRDRDLWEEHRRMKPRTSNGRSIYQFPRDILLGRREAAAERFLILDLGKWVR